MDKIYSLIVSFVGEQIDFELFSLKEYVEHENDLKEKMFSNLVKPSQEIIDKLIIRINEFGN